MFTWKKIYGQPLRGGRRLDPHYLSKMQYSFLVFGFTFQKYPEPAVHKVIHAMIRRGELQHRCQRKMLLRLA